MLSCYCRLPRSEALPTEWVGTPDLAEVISGIIAPRRVRRGVSAELSAEARRPSHQHQPSHQRQAGSGPAPASVRNPHRMRGKPGECAGEASSRARERCSRSRPERRAGDKACSPDGARTPPRHRTPAPFTASSSPIGAKSRLWRIKSTMKASNPMVNDEATKVTE